MKIGMSKREARSRVESGEFDWPDLEAIMRKVHPLIQGDSGKEPSRINPGLSVATAFNILWRAVRRPGKIKSNETMTATNILREFGESTPKQRPVKASVHCAHQELVSLETEE